MNVEIGTETLIFLFWEYLFRNFGILSLQCAYDLYGPVRNAFDAGNIRYEGKWEGVGPWKSRVF